MKTSRILSAATAAAMLGIVSGCSGVKAAPAPRISVLGDSYSTFRGCIPERNAVYYPRKSGNDVTESDQCWWAIVATNLLGYIERNESWSGSTICYTGYGKHNVAESSFVTRAALLGNPTHILICGGTNDSWANSPIGEYKWSDWTEGDLAAFRPAMAKMLSDIHAQYPSAKVYFILNSELKKDINDSVHEICAHYAVPCIDLHDIEKQSGHPSVKGMRAFADQVTAAIREAEGQ